MRIKLIVRMIIIIGLIMLNIAMLNASYQKTKKIKQRLIQKEKELMVSFSRYAHVQQQNKNLKDINAVCSSHLNIKKLEQVIETQLLDSSMNLDNTNYRIKLLNVVNNNDMRYLPFEAKIIASFSDVAGFLVKMEQYYPPLKISRFEIEPAENFETSIAIVSGTVYVPK